MDFETPYMSVTLVSGATGDGVHSSFDIGSFGYGSIQVTGTFTADVQLEISNDDSVWADLGSAIDTAGITELNLYSKYIRAEVKNHALGTVSAVLIAKRR